jgi:hypothetical protein
MAVSDIIGLAEKLIDYPFYSAVTGWEAER